MDGAGNQLFACSALSGDQNRYILIRDIQDFLPDSLFPGKKGSSGDLLDNLESCTLAEVEKKYILKVLQEQDGNKAKTASVLGITRKTLYTKLKEYGIHS